VADLSQPLADFGQFGASLAMSKVAQTCFSRSAAFLIDRAQEPRTYKTGPRYSLNRRFVLPAASFAY
jgi:hypothetical protein